MKSTISEQCRPQCHSMWQKGQLVRRRADSPRPDCIVLVTGRTSIGWFSGTMVWGLTWQGEKPGFHGSGSWDDNDFELYKGTVTLENC